MGIEADANKITRSDGVRAALKFSGVPRDLLKRVADNMPYVSVKGRGVELRLAHEIYAAAIADALRDLPPAEINDAPMALAVPGWWSPSTLKRVQAAFAERQIGTVLVNDAEAAVAGYLYAGNRLPETVAVVSLRAEQASVVMVRGCDAQPLALPSPTSVHEEGGSFLDSVVLRHLLHGLSDLGDEIDTNDPRTIATAQHAILQCRELRENLSTAVTESILLEVPGSSHRIRMVRSELEEITAPWVDSVLRMVRTAIEECTPTVEAVLLTGGLASMPLISQRVSADLALEVFVPDEPNLVVARGAERILARHTEPARHRPPSWWRRKPRTLDTNQSETRVMPDEATRRSEPTELEAILASILPAHPDAEDESASSESRIRETTRSESLVRR